MSTSEEKIAAFRFYIAAQNGCADACAILVKENANVNVKMKNGATQLFHAAREVHGDVCTVLLKSHLNVNKKWEDCATQYSKQLKRVMLKYILCYLNTMQI